jgi:two-component system LytT family sensor kinase
LTGHLILNLVFVDALVPVASTLPLNEVFYVCCRFLTIFERMRRILPHLLFWIFYWALMAYLEYFWLQDYITSWSDSKSISRAILGSFFYIIPYLAFAYCLVYFSLPQLVKKKHPFFIRLSLVVVPYVLAVFAIIQMAHEIVLPHVYENVVVPSFVFFEPRKFLSIMIEAAFPAGLLVGMTFVNSQLAAKEREKNLVKEKLTAELQLLKNQINPHFLFNTLNNIYALTIKKSDEAPDVVLKLSELLSFLLYEAGNDLITVEREVNFLDDYIAIQRIRYTDRLSLVFKKDIDNPGQTIAPLLLLPLVENAFKHGASENHFESYIHLDLTLKNGNLLFIIENSFEETDVSKQPSTIGLSNTNRQLELLYKEQQLTINKTDKLFSVRLQVNLDSYGKI